MELTKIEFEQILDKKLVNFVTKDDLRSMESRMDRKFATKDDLKSFATKDDLLSLEERMKDFAREQTSELGAMMAETVAIPLREHIQRCEGMRV